MENSPDILFFEMQTLGEWESLKTHSKIQLLSGTTLRVQPKTVCVRQSLHFALSRTILINRRDVVWTFCSFCEVEGCLKCVSVLIMHGESGFPGVEDKGTRKIVWSCVAFCIVGACF
ncbi:hypothetical protein CEXT_29751 [Caerostris extrusa]|uniref:Uncharacterized protein n=1 Tax=Caerostris extrusa TaxID=172846 RepID=A0AAV4U6A0_CAEEX|nr:hypothetical protein CEXT_29751 [Caerostris extrusa]